MCAEGQVETAPIDVVEDKLKEAIDGLTERSARIRYCVHQCSFMIRVVVRYFVVA